MIAIECALKQVGYSVQQLNCLHVNFMRYGQGLNLAGVRESAGHSFLEGFLDFNWQGIPMTPTTKRDSSLTTQDTEMADPFLESTEHK